VKTVLDLGVLGVTLLLMVTVGTELEARDFRAISRRKGMLAGTLLLPPLLLPVLGFLLARAFALPPHLTAGLLLLAACPVGDIANFYTLLARGNLALSVTVNTLSCLLSAATMAGAFALYRQFPGEPFTLALPTLTLVLRLTLLVALPVLAGMALRRWQPGWVADHCRLLRVLCVGGIIFLVGYVLANRWTQVVAEWRQTALASLVFMAAALGVGWAGARAARLSASDSLTVGIVVAARNVALAATIAVTLLHRIEFAVFAAVYFLTEVPLLLGVVAFRRWCERARETSVASNAI